MTDLFREVEEDLRREQFSKLWEKYGIYVIGAAVSIVLIVAAIVGWRAWSHSKTVEASAAYEALVVEMANMDPAESAAAFDEFADRASGGYRIMARLAQADRLLAAGDSEGALAAYEAVANDGRAPQIVRGMATVKAGLLLVDTLSLDDMRARVAPINREASPWRSNARELIALAAIREGKWAEADANAKLIIADQDTPAGLRDRSHVIQALAAPHLPREVAPVTDAAPAEETAAEPADEAEAPAETE
ncbi:tetratricopeptide repeat protein [Parvibaculum sp.]|uniref:tetratricopeptide repeat protein n=1 Tax=Parvibaculum sp. TaxID=2024848 RepID=UPI00391DF46E